MLIRHGDDPSWHVPDVQKYQNEEELQSLLAESPGLIPGVDPAGAVAVTELPVEANAIDIVVVEPTGRITLVECKLHTNREIRRQVVGQILEYAAGLREMLYEDFDERWQSRATTSLAAAATSANQDIDDEGFRAAVSSSLQTGQFRLVVAVDEIAPELKAIIEFVNQSTSSGLEVLALELGYVKDAGVEVLVPKVYGQEKTRKSSAGPRWSEEQYKAEVLEKADSAEAANGMLIIWEWAREHAHSVVWGSGQTVGVSVWFDLKDATPVLFFSIPTTYGPTVQIQFGNIKGHGISAKVMDSLANRLRSIPGGEAQLVGLEDADYNKWPKFPATPFFKDPSNGRAFIEALASFIEEARDSARDAPPP